MIGIAGLLGQQPGHAKGSAQNRPHEAQDVSLFQICFETLTASCPTIIAAPMVVAALVLRGRHCLSLGSAFAHKLDKGH